MHQILYMHIICIKEMTVILNMMILHLLIYHPSRIRPQLPLPCTIIPSQRTILSFNMAINLQRQTHTHNPFASSRSFGGLSKTYHGSLLNDLRILMDRPRTIMDITYSDAPGLRSRIPTYVHIDPGILSGY